MYSSVYESEGAVNLCNKYLNWKKKMLKLQKVLQFV